MRIQLGYQRVGNLAGAADALLLLTWDHPEERGVLPGKVFEYLGAGRPVLAMGCTAGVVHDLIASRGLGLSSNDPAEIAAQLTRWLAEKRAGGVADVAPAARAGFSREEQVRALEGVLERAAGPRAPAHEAGVRTRAPGALHPARNEG